jgi:hypothetical protein
VVGERESQVSQWALTWSCKTGAMMLVVESMSSHKVYQGEWASLDVDHHEESRLKTEGCDDPSMEIAPVWFDELEMSQTNCLEEATVLWLVLD